MENRTKEAALAAMMLALFFVTRTYKIQLIPGAFLIDFSGAVIYSAASLLSWPYIFVFAFSTFYLGSNLFSGVAMFFGCQAVFFISKSVSEIRRQYTVVSGQIVGYPVYGLLMHFTGLIDFKTFLVVGAVPILVNSITTTVGGLLIWGVLRRFEIVGNLASS